MDIQSIKQRFGIIGASPLLDNALRIATQVASTDLSVLISGESGTGKEVMPQIVHQFSARKHGPYIPVNCGAIPEGTIDSELFGHEKGAFTGAAGTRKGYFEEGNGGTIFLDEVAELPVETQVRLLRILETGEFMKVGSSQTQKTDVRIVAATNKDIPDEISRGHFREDLYYRLNTVPVKMPALKERKEDIHLLFRKFAADFAEKYRIPVVRLTPDAVEMLEHYRWPGNIRQLKNIAEQISIIETNREINSKLLSRFLPEHGVSNLPVLLRDVAGQSDHLSERDLLYKVLFDMKKDVNDLKALVARIITGEEVEFDMLQRALATNEQEGEKPAPVYHPPAETAPLDNPISEPAEFAKHEVLDESLSLVDKEKELIIKALAKHNNRKRKAAKELGISERTLYRKIREYHLSS